MACYGKGYTDRTYLPGKLFPRKNEEKIMYFKLTPTVQK